MNAGVRKLLGPGSWIAGITLLGAALRLYRLGSQSLWVDEAITFIIAQGPLSEVALARGWLVGMHALYYVIVHFIMFAGQSEVVLRLPSVVFGSLSIPLLYLVARRWFGTAAGVASGLLLAISPFHLFYSQEARPYAALLFFALLSIYCLQRLVTASGRPAWRLGFILSTAATLYCHAEALPFIAFTVLYAVLAAPRTDRFRWGVTFGAVALLCAPALIRLVVVPPVKPFAAGSYDSSGSARASVLAPIAYAAWTFGTGFSLGPSVRELRAPGRLRVTLGYAPLILPVLILFSVLLLAGGIRMWRTARGGLTLVAAWLVIPVAFLVLAGTVTGYPFNPRYAILSFPPFLLLLALGLVSLHSGWLRAAAWGILLLVNLAALGNYYFDPHYHREDYRNVIRVLAGAARPGDTVVVMAPYTRVMFAYYDPGPVRRVAYPPPSTSYDPARLPVDFAEIAAETDNLWVLLSRYEYIDPKDCLLHFLDRRFRREGDFAVPGAQLILYSTARTPRSSTPSVRDPACYIPSTGMNGSDRQRRRVV